MSVPLVLLTGVPRSGTTLSCELINGLADARALDEPLPVGTLVKRCMLDGKLDRAALCEAIAACAEEQRRSICERGLARSRHVAGRVSGRRIADARDLDGTRVRVGELGEIHVAQPRTDRFTLVIKHPVLFTALLDTLRVRFPVFAIVRNPLAVMGSWEGVPMMVRTGDLGLPDAVAPELARRLAAIADVTERQLCLLDWYFGMYETLLPRERVLRYEDIVDSGGAALAPVAPGAAELRVALAGRNAAAAYDHAHMHRVGELLLARDGAPWRSFYSSGEIEGLLDGIAKL